MSHSYILLFTQTDYFRPGKRHFVFTLSAPSEIFQASSALVTLQTKPIKRWFGISLVQEESSCSATDTTKQRGDWMGCYHSAVITPGTGWVTLPWSSLCPVFGEVKHHRGHCTLQAVVHRLPLAFSALNAHQNKATLACHSCNNLNSVVSPVYTLIRHLKRLVSFFFQNGYNNYIRSRLHCQLPEFSLLQTDLIISLK